MYVGLANIALFTGGFVFIAWRIEHHLPWIFGPVADRIVLGLMAFCEVTASVKYFGTKGALVSLLILGGTIAIWWYYHHRRLVH